MSAKEEFHERKSEWSALVQPLDEAIWDKWVAEGEAKNRYQRVLALRALATGCLVALLVAAVFWSRFSPPYDLIVRFIVACGAVALMLHSFRRRRYVMVLLFVALTLLYNPIVRCFSFSGGWQHALVIASILPFAATLLTAQNRAYRI